VQFTLVAGDFMQSEEFRAIKTILQEHGHTTRAFLVDGKNPTFTDEEVSEVVRRSDFVLLAVSNSFGETLRAGQVAEEQSVPFGIYAASAPGCYLGVNLVPLRVSAKLVFVFNDDEISPAEELFPNAIAVASGSPNWEKFHFPELTRAEAREKLAASEDEVLILVPGDKDLILNILLFSLTIEAAGIMVGEERRQVQVVIGLHPGDLNPISSYTDLGRLVPAGVSVTFICREAPESVPEGMNLKVFPTPHALPGADVLVTFVSTMGFEAACQRIPVICFFPGYGLTWFNSESNGKEWEQCRNGTAVPIYGSSPLQLAEQMILILTPGSDVPSLLSLRQEEFYPKPTEKGSVVRVIAKSLENFQS